MSEERKQAPWSVRILSVRSRLVTSPPTAKSESKSKSKPNEHLVDANPPG